jgi:hypothetical protein
MKFDDETRDVIMAVRGTGRLNMLNHRALRRGIEQLIEATDDPDGKYRRALDDLTEMKLKEFVACMAGLNPSYPYIEAGVHLSNKACRHMYIGGKPGGRAGGCDCPEGRCWYTEQKGRRERGEKALQPEAWTLTCCTHPVCQGGECKHPDVGGA